MLSAPSSHNVSVCSQGMRNIIWAVTIELLSWLLRELQHLKLAAILGQGGCFNAGLCKKKNPPRLEGVRSRELGVPAGFLKASVMSAFKRALHCGNQRLSSRLHCGEEE